MSTSTTHDTAPADTSADQLDRVLAAAAATASTLAATGHDERARWLRAMADALDAAADDLVPVAVEESALPEPRLRGEVARSSGQMRMFAHALDDGSLLEVTIDTADPDATPVPRPDLRRMLVPVGPVLVFAASNFPFAFSVCGGDTASALAAGCPVVVKAHPGHPRVSAMTAEVLKRALQEAGAPVGTLEVVFGFETGVTALRDPRIKAGAFTGSVPAGKALHRIAADRDDPIPFYGELGSLNPVFVLPGALAERSEAIVEGYVGSFTLGVGQFCTKPGLVFLPAGHGLRERLTSAVDGVATASMLNERIHRGYTEGVAALRERPGVREWVHGKASGGEASATLLQTTVPELLADSDALLEECFGPTSIVVEYADESELISAARAFPGSLTATVHAAAQDADTVSSLLPVLRDRAGRVVWNGWPTGVAVSWAMQHGGPFPATVGSVHTSVGATAARRFQRPVCFQDAPQQHLPEVLRDRNEHGIDRRVDGVLTRDDVTPAGAAG